MTGDQLREAWGHLGSVVAFHPELTRITQKTTATLLLCQLIYWGNKGKLAEGWVYKTSGELMDETGLTRHEQESARKKLRELGLITEKLAKQEGAPVVHFRVEWERIAELLESEGIAEKRKIRKAAMDMPKGGNGLPQSGKTTIQETTAKTTAETPAGETRARTRACPKPVVNQATTEHELPADWEPPESEAARARGRYPGLDLDRETQRFKLWHGARGSKRTYWLAEWWLWLSNGRSASGESRPRAPTGKRLTAWERHLEERGITQ